MCIKKKILKLKEHIIIYVICVWGDSDKIQMCCQKKKNCQKP